MQGADDQYQKKFWKKYSRCQSGFDCRPPEWVKLLASLPRRNPDRNTPVQPSVRAAALLNEARIAPKPEAELLEFTVPNCVARAS